MNSILYAITILSLAFTVRYRDTGFALIFNQEVLLCCTKPSVAWLESAWDRKPTTGRGGLAPCFLFHFQGFRSVFLRLLVSTVRSWAHKNLAKTVYCCQPCLCSLIKSSQIPPPSTWLVERKIWRKNMKCSVYQNLSSVALRLDMDLKSGLRPDLNPDPNPEPHRHTNPLKSILKKLT